MGCWRGYLSGARCRLAYGPAGATATHCIGFTFLVPARLGSPGKRAVKRVCVCVCVTVNKNSMLISAWQDWWNICRASRCWQWSRGVRVGGQAETKQNAHRRDVLYDVSLGAEDVAGFHFGAALRPGTRRQHHTHVWSEQLVRCWRRAARRFRSLPQPHGTSVSVQVSWNENPPRSYRDNDRRRHQQYLRYRRSRRRKPLLSVVVFPVFNSCSCSLQAVLVLTISHLYWRRTCSRSCMPLANIWFVNRERKRAENYNKWHDKFIFFNCNQHFGKCCLIKLLPYILFQKYIYILAFEMASQGNQHCANTIVLAQCWFPI